MYIRQESIIYLKLMAKNIYGLECLCSKSKIDLIVIKHAIHLMDKKAKYKSNQHNKASKLI